MVKRLPPVQETQVWSLGWEDPLEKEMATHSSNIAWKILTELEIPDHLTCLLRTCMQVRKQQLELDMEQQTGSK